MPILIMLDIDYKILKILYRSSKFLKVGQLARNLKLPHSTIGSCVKRLENEKLVIYERYKPVILSNKGIDLAKELIRHAQLLELLLFKELNLRAEEAHEESEKFNLLFSCNTINKICEKYGHPKECPCGENILNSNNCFCEDLKEN
ncbi:MAG: metal-dependent transcriptional regulator [Promethearchaeota archaeon]